MGYSYTLKAGITLDAIYEGFRVVHKRSELNAFTYKGREHFIEVTRKDHDDGAITGSVYRAISACANEKLVRRVASLRIDPDGRIVRPRYLIDYALKGIGKLDSTRYTINGMEFAEVYELIQQQAEGRRNVVARRKCRHY